MENGVLTEKVKPLVSEETSKRITSLRFLLIVFVVFIHNYYSSDTIAEAVEKGGSVVLLNENSIVYWLKLFISKGITRCAVPLFFIFSAFLQSIKNDDYSKLLKKKSKSLLLPYFIWTLIYGFYFAGLKIIVLKIAPQFIGNPENTALTWTKMEWFHKFFGYEFKPDGSFELPGFAYQFWFIRDLIILVIVSPVLNFFVKKIPFLFLCVISILYFCSVQIYFVENQALFYYSLGLLWGNYRINVFEKIDKINWLEIIFLFLTTFIISNLNKKYGSILHQCYVFFASIMLLKFSKNLTQRENLYNVLKYLSGFSFFLFAIHTPVLNEMLKKYWLYLFPMKNSFFSLFEFFGVALLNITIGTFIGIILKKICFPLFCLLNGGRK